MENSGTKLPVISRWIGRIEEFHHVLSYLSAAGMVIMMLPTVADVVFRLFFNAPIRGRIEFTGLVMAFVIYLGVPYAQAQKAHVGVTFFTDRIPSQVKKYFELFVYLFSVVILGFVIYATTNKAIDSVRVGEYFYGSTRFPLWPSRILVAFGFILLSLQFLADFFKSLMALWRK